MLELKSMDDKISDIDLIERYLEGKLTPDEVIRFDWRLEEDREFARKFRVRKAFPSLIQPTLETPGEEHAESRKSQNTASEVEGGTVSGPPKVSPPPSTCRYAALLVIGGSILIICFLAFLLFWSRQPDPMPEAVQAKTTAAALKDSVTRTASLTDPITTTKAPVAPDSGNQTAKPVKTTPIQAPVVLHYPPDNSTILRSSSIEFSWSQQTDSLTNFFVYTTNNNHMVYWRGIKPGTRSYFVREWTFRPGQYYWYVGTSRIRNNFTIVE